MVSLSFERVKLLFRHVPLLLLPLVHQLKPDKLEGENHLNGFLSLFDKRESDQ